MFSRKGARVATLAAAATATWAAGAAPAGAVAPPGPSDRIPAGVSVAGVGVGGLTIIQAAKLLDRRLAAPALRTVLVRTANRHFELSARRAQLSLDATRSAKRAYYAGQEAVEAQPAPAGESPSAVPAAIDVPAAIAYSRLAVRGWAAAVRRQVNHGPRDARLRIGVTKLRRRPSRTGRSLDAAALTTVLFPVLENPLSPRTIRQPVVSVRPRVTLTDLSRRYPVVLTVDRHNFKLRLFKALRLRRTYGIALGAAGFDTPSGLFRITQRLVNPPWHAPNRPWAGAYAGRTVPGGAPDNPLKARWLGITNGVGIHGTAEEWSIGSRASHGCIRMRVADVIRLYPQVPLGTPVRISR